MKVDFGQINLVCRDVEASLAFYRALGVEIPESKIHRTPTGIHHVDVTLPSGMLLEFDSVALAKAYNHGWKEFSGAGTRTVLGFDVPARGDVDALYEKLTGLGHPGSQPPFDAFWGSRYAMVADPDGNLVGIMSPQDPGRRSAPPNL
jgi:uncharacterized glyoxalase superfamily protein PhnB